MALRKQRCAELRRLGGATSSFWQQTAWIIQHHPSYHAGMQSRIGVSLKEHGMNQSAVSKDTPAWILFVWLSFIVSVSLMGIGIWNAPVDLWVRGYFMMGLFFVVGSTFTLAKTIRDNYEAQRAHNRAVDNKTDKSLGDYELRNG
jgi:hypothetical protein